MIELTDLQRDAVTELLNIAIGRAASALNEMVSDEVKLSVPFIDFVTRGEAAQRLREDAKDNDVIAVKQRFDGQFYGDVMLLFPERKSLDLVRMILKDAVPLDSLTELEQEALIEVGNVVLNACLGSLANQLGLRIESSLPMYLAGSSDKILENLVDDDESMQNDLVMFLHVDFALQRRDVYGYVAFVMDIESAQSFREIIESYISRSFA